MNISIGKVLDSIFDESKIYSLSRPDDVYVYNYWSIDLTFSQRANVLRKTQSYMGPILVHLIMYCFPDKNSGSKETIKSNEREMINKYLLKISIEILNYNKFNPLDLRVPVDKSFLRGIKNELRKGHNYSLLNFDDQAVSELQRIFLTYWNGLINKKLIKHNRNITYGELSEMLEETKAGVMESIN